MSAGCARCGHCCDPVILHEPLEELIAGATESGDFIREHWTEIGSELGDHLVRCDRFDPETRLCTAHIDRPPICERFPFYGGQPKAVWGPGHSVGEHAGGKLGCSYLADLPPGWRPADVRPLIPLEVL